MLNLTGLKPDELRKRIRGRAVYLWGASIVGFGVCRALERHGIVPRGFIDRSKRLQGKRALGYPVEEPTRLLASGMTRERNVFIIITSGHFEHEIMQSCLAAGLQPAVDVISSRLISPLDPSVDISGVCNLHCISCPRGNSTIHPPAGFMDLALYVKVLDKLLAELPLMGNMQLYNWGEPLLHPAVAEIIALTVERKVLCALSTNLNIRQDFVAAIKARPDWLKISTSGFGADYERTHTGGNWQLLLSNMYKLKEYKELYNPEMYVEVNYHLYRHNTGRQYEQMRDLCEKCNFSFRPNPAYLYALDTIKAYRQGRKLSVAAEETCAMLLLPLDEGIRRAEQQKELTCAEERCLPITWNGSVRMCGSYYEPMLVDNYLDMTLEDILVKRQQSDFCTECKSYALHRFTSVYVEERRLPGQEV